MNTATTKTIPDPEDNTKSDLKAFISAFELLSDRISTLQEDMALVRNAVIQTESSKYGLLAGSAFGFPPSCEVYRYPHKGDKFTTEDCNVPSKLDCVVVAFRFSCRGTCQGTNTDRFDGLPERPAFYHELVNHLHPIQANGDQDHLRTAEVKSLRGSVHECVDDEALERRLRKAVADGWIVNLLDNHHAGLEFSLVPPKPEFLIKITEVAGVLCKTEHVLACCDVINIYDCLPAAVALDRLTRRIPNPNRTVDVAGDDVKNVCRLSKNYMTGHPYFGLYWDEGVQLEYCNKWKALLTL
jgi:hypothetical protein